MVARVLEQPGEGLYPPVKRNAIVTGAMQGRHPAGEDGCAIGHADRVRNKGLVKLHGIACKLVEMGRLDHIITAETGVIRAMLIGYKDQDIGAWGH